MKVLLLIIFAELVLVSCAVSTFPPDAAGESANRIAELVANENAEVNGE